MQALDSVLDSIVSTYANARATIPCGQLVREILDDIRGGKYSIPIEEIRDLYERVLTAPGHADLAAATKAASRAVSQLKTQLPAVSFSVVSRKRNKESTLIHTGILCADLDKIGASLPDIRSVIEADPHTLVSFLSPTGAGLKVCFRIPEDSKRHLAAFRAISRHIGKLVNIEIDQACKDETRLCFVSYDPHLYTNDEAREIEILPEDETLERPRPKPLLSNGPYKESRKEIATRLLGDIQWDSETHGFCRCPGFEKHTTGSNPKECAIYLDGVPTIKCMHNSCAVVTDAFNAQLRSLIGKAEFVPTQRALPPPREADEIDLSNPRQELNTPLFPTEEGEFDPPEVFPPVEDASFYEDQPDPPQIITGVLYTGCKMVLGSASKSRKSFLSIDMGICVAMGLPWLGIPTSPGKVLYVNLELQKFSMRKRIKAIARQYGLTIDEVIANFDLLNLRGHSSSLEKLRAFIKKRAVQYSLIIIDPIYKTYGKRKENDAGDIADLLNDLDRMAFENGAAIVFVTHFSKGNQAEKEAIDRMSGSGVFARDPDTILVLTQHAQENCLSVHCITRDFPDPNPFAVRWTYPMFTRDPELDPSELKQPKGRKPDEVPFTIPSPKDYPTILPAYNPELSPDEWVIDLQTERLLFRQKKWQRDAGPSIRAKALRLKLAVQYRSKPQSPVVIGRPECIEAYIKAIQHPVWDLK